VTDVVFNNVSIQAEKGLTISNATVTAHDLTVTPTTGQPITLLENGKLNRD
jgi:hypothetical protein